MGLLLALLLGQTPLGWAQGNEITAITQPVGNVVVTIQIIMGAVATVLLMVTGVMIVRHEGAGIITFIFTVIAIVIAIKAGDIVNSFGTGRAIASTGAPIILLSARQYLRDVAWTLLQWGSWYLVLTKGLVHGRRACRI